MVSGYYKSVLFILRSIFGYPIFVILIILTGFVSCTEGVHRNQDREINEKDFAGSSSCRDCHQKEYDAWMSSHHQMSMDLADTTTVLGDFNDAHFESKGIRYHFYRKGKDFYVNTEGEGGIYRDYKIKYVFGFTPLQQYIIELDKGRKHCLLAAYDTKAGKWFDLQPNLEIHHEEWMHWTGGSMNWNNMCADCHSTFVRKNYDMQEETYNTVFTEIKLGCESCHGPGKAHNRYFESAWRKWISKPPVMRMTAKNTPQELVDDCARCHARRGMLTEVYDYRGQFADTYYPNLIHYPTYEKDGQIRDEDYEYGSFLQSKMYHTNISCRDCHDMHSYKLKKDGNQMCLTCHLPKYNEFEHHFHKKDTEASLCVNCHMVGKYYMGNDFRRDHSFRNPRPDQSVLYGTPNACTGCHKDKSDQWAADFVREKYGKKRPDHFSNRYLAGQSGQTDSLLAILKNRKDPDIIRASAVQLYTQSGVSLDIDLLKTLLRDQNALVRREALHALLSLDQELDKDMEIALDDPVRAVRILAARYFIHRNKKPRSEKFDRAEKEYFTDLKVNADFPAGNHQWALYYQAIGKPYESIRFYRKALQIDNYYNISRMNLALLEYQQGNVREAEKLYLKVTEQEPAYSYGYYMLGLLYNESGQHDESIRFLKKACETEPYISRAFYNYSLKLLEMRKYVEALKVLDNALKKESQNAALQYNKVLVLKELDRKKEALKILEKLLENDPYNRSYIDLKSLL